MIPVQVWAGARGGGRLQVAPARSIFRGGHVSHSAAKLRVAAPVSVLPQLHGRRQDQAERLSAGRPGHMPGT